MPQTPAETMKTLATIAQKNGAALSVPAAQLLMRYLGTDLWPLASEVAKLAAYAQARGAAVAEGEALRGFGIEVVDVRIKRADLPPANSEGIYKRMQTEREREAKEFRARGAEDAQKIRSQADKERTILIAEAKKTAEITRGQGDGEATKIFADSFGQDQDFFKFYRTLQAYKKTLSNKDTTVILSPDSEFLRTMDKGN